MNSNLIITLLIVGVIGVAGFILLSGSMQGDTANLTSDAAVNDMPVADTSEKMVAMEEVQKDSDAMQNIVEIASSNDDFSTLVTAVKQAGLVETLSSEGPFTVFAPTNEAFAKLPEATLQEVLADKDQLTAILTYHVVPGKVMAEDVINLTSATTVQGSDLTIDVEGSSVMVNNANVVSTDIEAENGVIYVIDAVLIPQ